MILHRIDYVWYVGCCMCCTGEEMGWCVQPAAWQQLDEDMSSGLGEKYCFMRWHPATNHAIWMHSEGEREFVFPIWLQREGNKLIWVIPNRPPNPTRLCQQSSQTSVQLQAWSEVVWGKTNNFSEKWQWDPSFIIKLWQQQSKHCKSVFLLYVELAFPVLACSVFNIFKATSKVMQIFLIPLYPIQCSNAQWLVFQSFKLSYHLYL